MFRCDSLLLGTEGIRPLVCVVFCVQVFQLMNSVDSNGIIIFSLPGLRLNKYYPLTIMLQLLKPNNF
uniref:Uncharacterized protein n=1 Tax=Anguilla anguilla TaxID=7936 RepID=A0A0E9QZM5_ANGAN